MKKGELNRKNQELSLENDRYKQELKKINNSRVMYLVNILPRNIRQWLMGERKNKQKENKDKILNIASKTTETMNGTICIIVNANISSSMLNSILAALMSQSYINYHIILISKNDKLEDYPKHDSRISVMNTKKDVGFSSILNEVYKLSNASFFCYIDELSNFDSSFLTDILKDINIKYDIYFEVSKCNSKKFIMFLNKDKVKSLIQYMNYDKQLNIEKFAGYDNIKIKYV